MKISLCSTLIGTILSSGVFASDIPWKRHTIDSSSEGADGIRVADINGNGRLDLTTGWEEGGVVRVYLNPGPEKVRSAWPAVTVGRVKSPEDAVFVDLDGDGNIDVVSSCEGNNQRVYVHWAPPPDKILDESAWKTEPFPVLENKSRWMFCLPLQVDGRHGIDLVLGSKDPNGVVGWLQSPPENPRDLTAWTWHELYKAGWIMSITPIEGPQDGHLNLHTARSGGNGTSFLVTDRKGPNRGLYLFQHPGYQAVQRNEKWNIRRLGGANHEVMFLDYRPMPAPGWEAIVATRNKEILAFARPEASAPNGGSASDLELAGTIPLAENTGNFKGVRWCDVDLDGRLDLIYSCEGATDGKSGVVWLKPIDGPNGIEWQRNEISGPEGVKFDLIQLIDLDGDGDLDVLTCEERDNLGVIWYENPTR
jgi:hypothetical protein